MSKKDRFRATFYKWIEIFMHYSMRGHMRYAREKGLSRSMLGAMFILNHKKDVGVTDLGEHLGVSSAAASQMLEKLVEEGYIQRAEDPSDRRMKKISLTQKGCDILQESIQARMLWIEELASNFTPEEEGQITSAMQLMIDKLQEMKPDEEDIEKM